MLQPFEGFPHVLESQQFTRPFVEEVFQTAEAMRQQPEAYANALEDQTAILAFGEVSTRTFLSFFIGLQRLGAKVSGSQAMNVVSSVVKGEDFDDTIRTLNSYHPNFLVIRWPKEGSLARAAELVGPACTVINAGDGPGQHPTQALLDLYTIWRHFGTFDRPIVIGVVGDLTRGRTTHSLVYLAAKLFPQISFFFISPPSARMKPEIIDYLHRHHRHFDEVTKPRMYELADAFDVLYMTRPQLNLQSDEVERERLINDYQPFVLIPDVVERMKDNAIILHPLPRTFELPTAIDADPRAKYFEQAGNGLWLRMALMERISAYRRSESV